MPCAESREYNEAIQNLRSCMSDEELRDGQPALNALGVPMPFSGNFADVYKVHCPATGNTWALKCFTREVSGLGERYRKVSSYLDEARLPFMVDFRYIEPGIRAGGQWHPFLKMRWVEGLALHEFVAQYLDRPATLRQLLQLWERLAARLREARIAHADLQHGNVLLVPMPQGQLALRLIDYDGMYVPALAGTRSAELGHPAYQHPQRLREGIFSLEVDRFSHLAIFCAVRCLIVGKRDLWRFHTGENLLFRERDFADPEDSKVFRALWGLPDEEARSLVGRLFLAAQAPLAETPLLGEVLSNGLVVPLSREEQSKVELALGGRAAVVRPSSVSSSKSVASEAKRPWWVAGPPPLPAAPAADMVGTVPDAASAAEPTPVETGRQSGAKGARGAWHLTAGLFRRADAALRGLAGEENAILHNLLRVAALVVVAALVFASVHMATQWAGEKEITIDLGGGVKLEMVRIPAGEFLMGSPDSEPGAQSNEKPQHRVQITEPFYLGKYEVTQEQWEAVMGSNPSRFKGAKNPVEQVSWDDCQAFLKKLNEEHGGRGGTFRLPTEAEWEYACRAGSTARWGFGDAHARLGKYAWYSANSGSSTHPVGEKRPNAWGLCDMHGNVWEWCSDWYDWNYYRKSPGNDPTGPSSGSYRVFYGDGSEGFSRVLRGGGWGYEAWFCRSAHRYTAMPGDEFGHLGFRVSLALIGEITRPQGPPVPPPASVLGDFRITSNVYSETDDLDAAIANELGPDYRLADWNDVLEHAHRIEQWADAIGLQKSEEESLFVSRDGKRRWNGNRYYFLTRWNGQKRASYMAHTNIKNNYICLGSWFGTKYRALAIRLAADTGTKRTGQPSNTPAAPAQAAPGPRMGPQQSPAGSEVPSVEITPPQSTVEVSTLNREIALDLGGGVRLELVLIPDGEFLMGSPDSDRDAGSDENPQHPVRITKPFYLGKYEVTQEQWEAVMGSNPSHFKGPKNPVEQVSWDDCQAFLGKLNGQEGATGGAFRLPTEAEWEYACRAGSSTRWCYGDDEDRLSEHAWHTANSASSTHPVGQKRPNAWGLYDMHGNVWEWCADWYDGDYYRESPGSDPTGPSSGSGRVFRGGGWGSYASRCRSALRRPPGYRPSGLGLRVSLMAAGGSGE